MPSLTFLALLFAVLYFVKSKQQFARISLLGAHLGRYRLEKLMEDLSEGYLRALDEKDGDRQQQLWNHLEQKEVQLSDQLQRLALDFAQVQSPLVKVGKWPVAPVRPDIQSWHVPWWPHLHKDVRQQYNRHLDDARQFSPARYDHPDRPRYS